MQYKEKSQKNKTTNREDETIQKVLLNRQSIQNNQKQ